MFINHYPLSLFQTLAIAISIYGLHYTYWQLTVGARRRRLAASRGCQAVPRWRLWDPFFGLDFLWNSARDIKAHTGLESMQRRYERAGTNTASFKLLGYT